MRKSFVIVAGALMAALIPSGTTVIGLGSLAAAVSLVASSEAVADTAVLPGWRHPCGRNPRCHERVVGRLLDRRRAMRGNIAAR